MGCEMIDLNVGRAVNGVSISAGSGARIGAGSGADILGFRRIVFGLIRNLESKRNASRM
jgi:hypothetical protein